MSIAETESKQRNSRPKVLVAVLILLLLLLGWLYLSYFIELRVFAQFRQLKGVVVHRVDDSWTATFNGRINRQVSLLLADSNVRDDDLSQIRWITDLRGVDLSRTAVTDEVIRQMAVRDSIKSIDLN